MLNRNYFKGWYFKCCNGVKTIAFIPAYHRNNHKETASLQIITNDTVFDLPFTSLGYQENPLFIKLGNCIFSGKGIKLNIQNNKLFAQGTLRFSNLSPIKYDIMGPFQLVPSMQCRHSVYSMKHIIDGEIIVNGHEFSFQNGVGYIEGDCGRSFPKRYIWTQCCFNNDSLMLSIADIPLFAFNFTGIIGIVMHNGKERRIATYLGAKLKRIAGNTVTVEQNNYCLTAQLIKKNALPLYAPNNGVMNRTIHESASCTAYYRFSYKEKTIWEFTSDKASFEFEYR